MGRIVLIDDSEALLDVISAMLTGGGHTVLATTSGSIAFEKLARCDVDVVLTDLYMPPPDGFEIMRHVRALAAPVPVIVMSSNPIGVDVFRAARALGAVGTLQKPFTSEKLLNAVASALAQKPATGSATVLPKSA